jgi:hypothetical protein
LDPDTLASRESGMDKKDKWKDAEKGIEEDFFMKKHREWLEKNRREKAELVRRKEKTKEELLCPRCSKPLVEKEFTKSRVLTCESCRGGWLDRQNLEELLS